MKVLVIGLGSIGKKHVNALKIIDPNVSIYALRSLDSIDNVEGVENISNLVPEIISSLDFIIISNPTACHEETIRSLIHFEIPLFIEKPLFGDLGPSDLVDQVISKKIVTYVACNLRFLGCIDYTRNFLKTKHINEVNSYCGSYLPDWRPGQDFRKIYSANKSLGGGVHIDLIHEIDYLYWLFGKPLESFSYKTSNSFLNISSIDYANFIFKYANFSANLILNYFRRDSKRTLEILLNDGTIYVDLLKNDVTFLGEKIYSSQKGIHHTYEDQLRFFIKNILTKEIAFNSIDEAYNVLEICLKEND